MPGTRRLRVQEALFACAVLCTAVLSSADQWRDTDLLLTLAVLAIGTHLLPMTARGVHISGSFMGWCVLHQACA